MCGIDLKAAYLLSAGITGFRRPREKIYAWQYAEMRPHKFDCISALDIVPEKALLYNRDESPHAYLFAESN